jgi:hypothetical protein
MIGGGTRLEVTHDFGGRESQIPKRRGTFQGLQRSLCGGKTLLYSVQNILFRELHTF